MKKPFLLLASLIIHCFTFGQIIPISVIQETTNPTGASDFEGQTLETQGIVTASAQDNDLGAVYIQQQFVDDWAGIKLVGSSQLADLERGQFVTIEGVVEENLGETQISVTSLEVLFDASIQTTFVDPALFANYSLEAEKYEGMLVSFNQIPELVLVTDSNPDNPNNFGEWSVGFDANPNNSCRVLTGRQTSDLTSSLWVSYINDSTWVDNSGTLQVEAIIINEESQFLQISGIISYSFSNFK